MSDYRVKRRCAFGPVDVAGPCDAIDLPRHYWPAPSAQRGANERSDLCENAKPVRWGCGEASNRICRRCPAAAQDGLAASRAAHRAIDRPTAGEAANNNPLAAPARAALGPSTGWPIVHRGCLPQYPSDFRALDAAARPRAAGGGYPAVAAGARSVPGLGRAASAPLVRRPRSSQQSTGVDTLFIIYRWRGSFRQHSSVEGNHVV
jgi:hypothetical protein